MDVSDYRQQYARELEQAGQRRTRFRDLVGGARAADRLLTSAAATSSAGDEDEYVQRRLIEGLERRSKALVPAAKAVQLLGYDVHAEYFPLLRQIVRQPPTRAAKREAVRLLGADPASKQLLLDLFKDKRESR